MATPLGVGLVFELNSGRAGALEHANCALDIECIAVAGVGIDNNGEIDPLADVRQRIGDFGPRDEANVGPPELGIGNGRAGKINRFKSGIGGERSGQCIEDAGRDDNRWALEPGQQAGRCVGLHPATPAIFRLDTSTGVQRMPLASGLRLSSMRNV